MKSLSNQRPGASFGRVFWICLISSVVVSALAGLGLLQGVDLWGIEVSQTYTSRLADTVGGVFSSVGDAEVITIFFGVMCVALVLAGRWLLTLRLVVAYAVIGVVELLMKLFLPTPTLPDFVGRTGEYASAFGVAYSYPYPSGHMVRWVFVLGVVFVLWPNRPARAVILIILAGVAATRVYLGVHWPSDIVGGALMSVAGIAWAFDMEMKKIKKNREAR